jgi:hypothetical protein
MIKRNNRTNRGETAIEKFQFLRPLPEKLESAAGGRMIQGEIPNGEL